MASRSRDSIAITHPALAAQLVDRSLADVLTHGSGKKVAWRCDAGHEWVESVLNRSHGRGCPYCSNKRVLPGFNDLATTHPSLASELEDPTDGRTVTFGTSRKLRWRCRFGHGWDATPRARLRGAGCPVCSGKKVLRGFNDMATTHPEIVGLLADPADAVRFTAGSNKAVRWRCPKGHEWSAPPARVVPAGGGCPVCANRRVVPGVNDLATQRPDIAAEAVDPHAVERVVAGSGERLAWRCDCGHEWSARAAERCGAHATGCPVCSGGRVSVEELDLLEAVRAIAGPGTEVLANDRGIIAPMELDIVVPDARLAIEYNGVYWHSEAAGSDAGRHAAKLRACEAAGYGLVTVWSDDWVDHREQVLGLLASRLGRARVSGRASVGARSLSVVPVDGCVAAEFMDSNHLQGRVTASWHIGLADGDGNLLAVLSLRAPRDSARAARPHGDWCIQRYATACHVPGGFSKLLAHAERELAHEGTPVSRWVSFSSNDVSDGSMYERCGFTLDGELPPDYRYAGSLTGWRRRPKEGFQRKRFRDDPSLVWDESWTEHEAALANGLYRVYDSGKKRWVRDVSDA